MLTTTNSGCIGETLIFRIPKEFFVEIIIKTLRDTSTWVCFFFGYLFFMTFQALKPREVPLLQLFVILLIFTIMKFPFFQNASGPTPLAYFACTGITMVTAYLSLGSFNIKALSEQKWPALFPGSYRMPILVLIVFIIQYSSGVLIEPRQDLATHYFQHKHCLDELIPGFSLGQALTFIYKYFRALKASY